jgi:hypothetical protein
VGSLNECDYKTYYMFIERIAHQNDTHYILTPAKTNFVMYNFVRCFFLGDSFMFIYIYRLIYIYTHIHI